MRKIFLTIIMALTAISASAQHPGIYHQGFGHHPMHEGLMTNVHFNYHRHPDNRSILDVVYLRNGSEMVGMITEMIPGESISLLTYDGSTHVYSLDEVIMTGKKYGRWSREYRRQIWKMEGFNNPKGYFGIIEFGSALMFTSENIRVGLTLINGYRFMPQFAIGIGTGFRLYAHDGELSIPLYLHVRSDFFDRDQTPFIALNAGIQWSVGWEEHAGLVLEPSFGYSINTGERGRMNFSIGLAVDMYDDTDNYYDLGMNIKIGYSF